MGYGKFKIVIWVKDNYEATRTTINDMRLKYDWSYLVMGDEVCPTSGRRHVDGYYEYPTDRKWSTENIKWLKAFGTGYGDLQKAKGSAGENFDYSVKEDRHTEEHGVAVRNGESLTLTQRKEQLLAGDITAEDIAVEDPGQYHMYGRTLNKLEDIALRRRFRTEMTTCEWIYGSTGSGKSHKAFENFNPDTHYVWKLNDKGWQDGYLQQDTVIINDYRGEIRYNDLLQLIDKWPHSLPRRGREPMPFTSKHIIITSSLRPDQIYVNRVQEDALDQLYRRIQLTKCDVPIPEYPVNAQRKRGRPKGSKNKPKT